MCFILSYVVQTINSREIGSEYYTKVHVGTLVMYIKYYRQSDRKCKPEIGSVNIQALSIIHLVNYLQTGLVLIYALTRRKKNVFQFLGFFFVSVCLGQSIFTLLQMHDF